MFGDQPIPLETVIAWESAIERKDGPTSLIFSPEPSTMVRENRLTQMTSQKGAYILEEASAGKEQTEVVLFGYRQRSSTYCREVRKIFDR